MKKSRPGILLTVLCREADKERMIHLIFKHTTTLGIREKYCQRHTLNRKMESVETPYGTIRRKTSFGYGVQRRKYEYEDLAGIAKKNSMSILQIVTDLDGYPVQRRHH